MHLTGVTERPNVGCSSGEMLPTTGPKICLAKPPR